MASKYAIQSILENRPLDMPEDPPEMPLRFRICRKVRRVDEIAAWM
jgi:hypothetical protein